MVMRVHLNRISVVLADKHITNHWLATQLGVTDITVSRWCNNKNQPPINRLVEIAELLDADVKELIEDL